MSSGTVAMLAAFSTPLVVMPFAMALDIVENAVTSSNNATLAGAPIKAADLFDALSGGASWTK